MSHRSRSTVVLVLVLGLVGCGNRTGSPPVRPPASGEFRRLELPGFSIDVPTGLGVGDGHITSYRTGDVTMQGSGRSFELSWHVGNIFLGASLTAVVRRFMAAVEGHYELQAPRTTTAGGQLAGVVELTVQDREGVLANIACGKRAVMLVLTGRQVAALRTHILDSFDCHPELAAEIALDGAPIGVDEPELLADWYQMSNATGFTLTNDMYMLRFQLNADGGDSQTAEFRDALRDLGNTLPLFTWSYTRLEKRWARDGSERIFQHGTLEGSGQQIPVLLAGWRCGGESLIVLAVPLIPVPDLDPVVSLLMKLRCARPGDPPLKLRSEPP